MTVTRETQNPRQLSLKSHVDCTGLRLNPELGRDKPANNYLSHRKVFAVAVKRNSCADTGKLCDFCLGALAQSRKCLLPPSTLSVRPSARPYSPFLHIFLLSLHSIAFSVEAVSLNDITSFRPLSPIATGNHLDLAEKNP